MLHVFFISHTIVRMCFHQPTIQYTSGSHLTRISQQESLTKQTCGLKPAGLFCQGILTN